MERELEGRVKHVDIEAIDFICKMMNQSPAEDPATARRRMSCGESKLRPAEKWRVAETQKEKSRFFLG